MTKPLILVIDDEPDVFEAIFDCLGDDYELSHAGNGAAGLRLFKDRSPDLIILDMRMPVMDGVGFLKRIAATPDDLFSIIILTGHSHGTDIKECFEMGITSFLRKPFDYYELRGQVKQAILSKKLLEHLDTENKYLNHLLNEQEISSFEAQQC